MEYHQQPGSNSLRGNLNLFVFFFLFNITWSKDYFRTIILEFFLIFLKMCWDALSVHLVMLPTLIIRTQHLFFIHWGTLQDFIWNQRIPLI